MGGTGAPAHLVLPAVTLALPSVAMVARMTRSSVLDVLREDYVRTARAKGVAERLVVSKHALRNAAIPILTLLGLQAGQLMGGAVLTETVFAWPGLGPAHGQGDLRPRLRAGAGGGAGVRGGLRRSSTSRWISPTARWIRACRGRASAMAISAAGALEGPAVAVVETGRLSAWGQFRRNRLAVAGLAIVALLLIAALGAPWLAPADPAKQSLIEKRAKPGGKFLLGADEFGRDILSRVIYGSRVALIVSVLSVAVALVARAHARLPGRLRSAAGPTRWSCGPPRCCWPFPISCSPSRWCPRSAPACSTPRSRWASGARPP